MVKEQFIGNWKLISCEVHHSDNRVTYPMGENAIGRLIYDEEGYMSVQVVRPGRKVFISNDLFKGTSEEIKAAFEGILTYFGTYDVNKQKGTITHYIEACSFPNWEDTDQTRFFNISGNRLTLTTGPMVMGGEEVEVLLIWEHL